MPRRHPSRPEPVSAEDAALFRDAVGPLRELTPAPLPPRAAPPPPRAHMRQRDEAAVGTELLSIDPALLDTGAGLTYLKDGHSPRLLRKLKRGGYSVVDELDLHHMDARAARHAIADFLADATTHGRGCVRIVHGKGWRSGPGGPVLKGLVDQLLRRRSDVIAFTSARPSDGGTGAVLVLLRTD